MTTARKRFPALRCRMGDWIYYVTYFRFSDISEWIRPTEEVHTNPRLSERIQRHLNQKHADDISSYLCTEPQRLFNALVVGVYGGEPQFGPMSVTVDARTGWTPLAEAEEFELQAGVGLLQFDGSERLFAIDGQHRVAGIKKAVQKSPELGEDEIAVIFVGHEESASGLARTRRLFTTLNKSAKRVSTADIVLLDEDNSFAITVRRIVNEFDAFKGGRLVRFEGNGSAIPASDKDDITSIIALYEVSQDLYGPKPTGPFQKARKALLNARQDDATLDLLYDTNSAFWSSIARAFPVMNDVYEGTRLAGDLRTLDSNHLLARPIGQRVVAGAVYVLMSRGLRLGQAVEALAGVETSLVADVWHHLLWDPVHRKMLTTAKNRALAETYLLLSIDQEARTDKMLQNFEIFRKQRDAEG